MISPQDNTRYSRSLETQKRLSFAENYNKWLFEEIREYLGSNILEVGCAIGNFTKKLIDKTRVCVVDIEDEYVRQVQSDFKGHDNFKAYTCDVSSEDVLKLGPGGFDTIICFNVLEHIKDDQAALSHMRQLLSQGGVLCLIVPAFPCLFGEMDETDGHYRRYKKEALIKMLKGQGFAILRSKYINFLGFFGWWFNARALKRKYIPFFQMLAYDRLIPFVRLMEKIFKPPLGQSLVVIAKKRGQA